MRRSEHDQRKDRNNEFLTPMGMLMQLAREKHFLTKSSSRDVFGFRPDLLEVLKTYGDKFVLVSYQSERVTAAHGEASAKWPS